MSFDADKLYRLLPSFYRIRDAEIAIAAGRSEQDGPLRALISIVAEQVAVLEDDLEQLYDDQFIETCAEWVVPYIGDLVGARGLFVFKNAKFSQRALVADTVADRRRKGTAESIRRLARDVTQWDASVVEYFQFVATTQYMNHIRPNNLVTADLRNSRALELIDTPFDSMAHTFEARRIPSNRGKYNIPNIGIYLWRLGAYRVSFAPPAPAGAGQFRFDALGKDIALFARPEDDLHQVPEPISRSQLDADLTRYYGSARSIAIRVNGVEVPPDQVRMCILSDVGAGNWAQTPSDKYIVDPVLGRFLVPNTFAPGAIIRVLYHYGFSADMGGGEYGREQTFTSLSPVVPVQAPAKIQDALNGLASGGAVEVGDDEIYVEPISIHAPAGGEIELRAKNQARPIVALTADCVLRGDDESAITLNGLVISGAAIRIPASSNGLRLLRLRHCTLLSGTSPAALIVEAPNVTVEVDSCIVEGIWAVDGAILQISNSIIDAHQPDAVAFAGIFGSDAGAALQVDNSTIIGKVHALQIDASDSIFFARLGRFDFWDGPVLAERLQQGCVRFCYVPPGSRVPRRHHCQPITDRDDARVRPLFTSRRYGDAGYCQLSDRCAVEIRTGADDGAEMGAFHDLFQPQRAGNLNARLEEYLRFGLEAGIFYGS